MPVKSQLPVALTIAGSDSGGGAGIQADLATFAGLGVFGTSAITAITAQNTTGVQGVWLIDPDAVASQITSILSDIKIKAIKIGMLGNTDTINAVVQVLPSKEEIPIVVDPVMIAKGGESLLAEGAISALIDVLLPKASIITPNIPEMEKLVGFEITNRDLEQKAVYELWKTTGTCVLLKGGHRSESRHDLFYDGNRFVWLSDEGVIIDHPVHGTGCTFSSAIAAYLALGNSLADAVTLGKKHINELLAHYWMPGHGNPVLKHTYKLLKNAEQSHILQKLDTAFRELSALEGITKLVPEIGMNLGYCLPEASGYEDVAGYPGRITGCDGRLVTPTGPRFGGSRHTARVVLAANRMYPEIRCVLPIRFSIKAIELLRRMELPIGCFDRNQEPGDGLEGSTLEWGTTYALQQAGVALAVIYDEGGVGKEPVIRLLGAEPGDIVQIVSALLELLK